MPPSAWQIEQGTGGNLDRDPRVHLPGRKAEGDWATVDGVPRGISHATGVFGTLSRAETVERGEAGIGRGRRRWVGTQYRW